MDVTSDFANGGIEQADRMLDELDLFMRKLENAGVIKGWTEFMGKDESEGDGK